MFCVDLFNSFGRADDAHKLNILAAFCLNEVDCRNCAAAGCEHRIENDDFAVCDIVGKFAVVLLGFKRFVVAIKTDVSDFCGGDKSKDTVYHAETCAENRNDCDVICNNAGFSDRNRGFNLNFLRIDIAESLKCHKHCDFFHKFAKLFAAGTFITHNCNFVCDKRVIENGYVVHKTPHNIYF